jgi:flagellar basal body rod protein FlgG
MRDMLPGPLRSTQRSLDVGIDGSALRIAFFQVRCGHEVRFTRAGRLGVDREGRLKLLATSEDDWLLDPPVRLPGDGTGITIESDGRVRVSGIDPPETSEVGRIAAVLFVNPDGLRPNGGGLYEPTPASGGPVVTTFGTPETGELVQGCVESSNINESALHKRMTWLHSMMELLAEGSNE